MRVGIFILIQLLILISSGIQAQTAIPESLFTDDYSLNPEDEGKLGFSIDNISFFKNNETDGDIQKGYTLPGFRINPRLVYSPASMIRLEAGLSLLRYWGADKYPNYAYQDIAEWKADGYQYGFHILPFFRAQIQPAPQLNIVLGDIYGGSNHGLIEPLYNPELSYTADPELGVQILYNSGVAHFDAWVNWESFTFRNDTHNEAVNIGVSSCLHITNPQSSFYLGIPVQVLLAHRGGELDQFVGEILTLVNGSAGLQFGFNSANPVFKSVTLNLMGAAYQSGSSKTDLLPFERGWAFYSNLNFQIWKTNLKMAVWRSGDFINILGNPVFGNTSITIDGRTFPRTLVLNPGLKYEQAFGKGFYLGADVEFFYNPELIAYHDKAIGQITKSFTWSTGLYLRINPSIVLK
ncbi:hypothetical protein FACS189426_05390 [Bacteroidia bacterium]|nr:hypothetical protein FACS189426_05390 [Bacteroidia bacterium]